MGYNLKDESEVKEYLKNLGIEYRFGCYHEKKPEVCHLLGDYMEAIKKDFEKAAKVYKNNCDDSSHGKSCFKYGTYLLLGKGVKEVDSKTALSYLEEGCKSEDADACLHAGLMRVSLTPFKDVEKQVEKGFEMLKKSCIGNNPHACHYVAGMYMTGLKGEGPKLKKKSGELYSTDKNSFEVLKDMRKAFEFTVKACALGHLHACANLTQMYKRGEGVEQNEELAEKFRKLTLEMESELKKEKPQLQFQQ